MTSLRQASTPINVFTNMNRTTSVDIEANCEPAGRISGKVFGLNSQ